ncbi:hypothetical protein OFN94_20620, partial [Escherichia coli]
LMMSLWDALRMNMMISYQELVRTFLNMVSLSCGPMQDFRPGKEKLYEYPAEITPSNFIHTLNLKSHYLHKLLTI